MYRSLSDLRDSVARLIEQQGEDAPCAAFIFTKKDVFYYERGENGLPNLDEEKYLSEDDTDKVLQQVSGSYIYEEMAEFIDQEVKMIRKKKTV